MREALVAVFICSLCVVSSSPNTVGIGTLIQHLGNLVQSDNSITESYSSSANPGCNDHQVIQVLYNSKGIDKEYQSELVKSVFLSLQELDENDFIPEFVDISKMGFPSEVAHKVWSNCSVVAVSLLRNNELSQFASAYDDLVKSTPTLPSILHIFTPRLIRNSPNPYDFVKVLSLQMNRKALSVALLNRVEKVGIKKLIPVLDSNDETQLEWMKEYVKTASQQIIQKVSFTPPVFIDNPNHLDSFRETLNEYIGFRVPCDKENETVSDNQQQHKIGVLLLASKGSHIAMDLAKEKNHMQMGWFSPNILEHEENAYGTDEQSGNNNANEKSKQNNETNPNPSTMNAFFGLYTVNYVGSNGWDNPARRRMLRELTKHTGASPRILGSVLAYDSALLAVNKIRQSQSAKSSMILQGLSGKLEFDDEGYRKDGLFYGVSAVPELASPSATLLQPSTWILEDTVTVMEKVDNQFLIKDFQVATSSVLTSEELRALANKTKTDVGCEEHIMNIITHDPFNQMPYNYYFKEENLPENLLIPNQLGFGITFLCFHANNGTRSDDEPLKTTLQIACTPGTRTSEPVQCFKSHVKLRQKRSPGGDSLPPTIYQYGFGNNFDDWNQTPQNSKWSKPKDEAGQSYYSQGYTPLPSNIKRQDSSVAAASEASTTPAPAPTPKLPELRQILKAAKPFVGSCIGSSTGCAMCVLVLGRLPLGVLPAACTGPCFVGTFGSCGSLLGRVFSETTVICTELFRQGYMDIETFMADSEFGKMISTQFPETMEGYTFLATPIVEAMKKSNLVTHLVSTIALPWAQHMKYLLGRTNQPSFPGLLVHILGFIICNLAGHICSIFQQSSITFTSCLTTFLTIILLFLHFQRQKKKLH